MRKNNKQKYMPYILTGLRLLVGWHFLYEGLSKLFAENWSAYNFLANTTGAFSGFYHWLAASTELLKVVDILNVYGLLLIGLALFLGVFIRYASVAGILLMSLYYFAYPPYGVSLMSSGEGSLYIVNKVFIEAAILVFFVFYRDTWYGIDTLLAILRKKRADGGAEFEGKEQSAVNTRREVLKNLAALPVLGLMGWGALQNQKKYSVDVMSGATIQVTQTALGELKGELPKGKIGNHEISRLVIGGNLIGGWAHARDLIYVSSLFKAYNTEKKIYETMMLAEQAGINTINIGFPTNPLMAKYKQAFGSKIKVISQVAHKSESGNIYEKIDRAIDYGADIIQVQGNACDWLVRDNKIDVVAKMMDHIRKQGLTAGLASHTIDAMIACEEYGIIPDYYMKTMHHDKYWSAHPKENRIPFEVDGKRHLDHNKFHNNLFCLFPDRTIEFVNRAKVPVMGYKVLAAGAIPPEDGFKWAFENGADFICVGMFDFQVVNDVNICIDTLNNLQNRKRQWFG